MKKIVYHIGDKVRIINPLFVQRIGYLWTKEYVIKNIITAEQQEALKEFLNKYNIGTTSFTSAPYNEIIDRLAYWILKQRGFGSNERAIHTELQESARGKITEVIKKRVVKTGTYHAEYSGGWEEPEYESPHLSNEKSHVLLTLNHYLPLSFDNNLDNKDDIWPPEIEECNVELCERMRKWKACIYPNNQPTWELGIFTASDKKEALKKVCECHGLDADDICLDEVKD